MKDNDTVQGTEKEFMDLFEDLTGSLNDWQVWSDLMAMMACSLSNAFDCNEKRIKDREKEYSESEKRLGGNEIPAKIFVVVTQALERNPDQYGDSPEEYDEMLENECSRCPMNRL